MATIKIELQEGKDMAVLLKIRDLVMDSVIDTLKLPSDDRNIRIIEYKPELFLMKAPYDVIIEISMFTGRSKETKKKLYQSIVNKLDIYGIFKKDSVFIIINEIAQENWGLRGGIPADEINLGFKVNV
jgi:phenylpyruvate tautomerase PptA (4-oxalocrotonate tautomerase family)